MKWRLRTFCLVSFFCLLLASIPQMPVLADDTWAEYIIDSELDYASGITTGYIDTDEYPDIVAAGSYAGDVVWYRAPSTPLKSTWKKYVIDDELGYAWDVSIGDDRSRDDYSTYAGMTYGMLSVLW